MTPDFSAPDGCGASILAIVERDRRIPLELRSEVAQRTYLRIRSGQANGLSVNYVRKVARNIFIDLLRDEKRRTAAEREAEKRPASRRDADSDAQCIDQPFLTTRIMDEVAALPEHLRVSSWNGPLMATCPRRLPRPSASRQVPSAGDCAKHDYESREVSA